MTTKKLVHITTVPLTFIFLRGQIAFMKTQGFEIHAISSPGPLLDQFAQDEDIHTYPVDMPRCITPLQDLRALFQIRQLLQKIKPDIVHAHTPKGGLLGMIAATMIGTPRRIYHMHGLPLMTATKSKRLLLTLTEQVSCKISHQVITVGQSLREVALTERLCAPEKITILGAGSANGIDAQKQFNPTHLGPEAGRQKRRELGIPQDATVLGFVGRIVREKGIVELIEAWKNIRQTHTNTHLMIIGTFESQDPIPEKTQLILRTDHRIHLVGFVNDPAPLYAAMDIFVLPTYREGLPTAPLEASAMQLPVVATLIPGCTDAVLHGITGTLIPPKDATALETAIRLYLNNPDLRSLHGFAGRTRVLQDFTQSRIWTDLLSLYAAAS